MQPGTHRGGGRADGGHGSRMAANGSRNRALACMFRLCSAGEARSGDHARFGTCARDAIAIPVSARSCAGPTMCCSTARSAPACWRRSKATRSSPASGSTSARPSFPDDLETPATSLLLEGVTRLARRLAGGARGDASIASYSGSARRRRFCEQFATRFQLRSRPPRAGGSGGAGLEGVTCGLDPGGFLLLREDNGTETVILAGGVRPI